MDDRGRLDVLDEHPERRRRLTVVEYHRLGELGFFTEGERLELIEGRLAAYKAECWEVKRSGRLVV